MNIILNSIKSLLKIGLRWRNYTRLQKESDVADNAKGDCEISPTIVLQSIKIEIMI